MVFSKKSREMLTLLQAAALVLLCFICNVANSHDITDYKFNVFELLKYKKERSGSNKYLDSVRINKITHQDIKSDSKVIGKDIEIKYSIGSNYKYIDPDMLDFPFPSVEFILRNDNEGITQFKSILIENTAITNKAYDDSRGILKNGEYTIIYRVLPNGISEHPRGFCLNLKEIKVDVTNLNAKISVEEAKQIAMKNAQIKDDVLSIIYIKIPQGNKIYNTTSVITKGSLLWLNNFISKPFILCN